MHVTDWTAAPYGQTQQSIIDMVQRFVRQGGSPRGLELRLGERRTAEERANIGLGILSALSSAPRTRPLEELELQGLPLGPDICAQLAAAAPRPMQIKLRGYDLSGAPAGGAASGAAAAAASMPAAAAAAGGAGERSDTAGVVQVLQAAAPGLQRLTLEGATSARGWATELIVALQRCTHVDTLTLHTGYGRGREGGYQTALPLLEALSALPRLHTLELRVPANVAQCYQGDSSSPALAAPLQQLRGLTRLVVEGAAPAAVLPALPLLPQLAVLHMPQTVFTPAALQQLSAGAPSLTHLRVKCVDSQGTASPPPGAGSVSLPPRLQSLEILECVAPRMLVALQLPACCTQLQVPGFNLGLQDEDDMATRYDDERMEEYCAEAGELIAACDLLATHSFDAAALPSPFSITGINVSDDDAVPGGFQALAAALQRLRLWGLDMYSKHVASEFVEAMASRLAELEALELSFMDCWDMPLLQSLTRLRDLRLTFEAVEADCGRRLSRVMISLINALPCLEYLHLSMFIHPEEDPSWYIEGMCSFKDAFRQTRAALERCGRDSLTVATDMNLNYVGSASDDAEGYGEDDEADDQVVPSGSGYWR